MAALSISTKRESAAAALQGISILAFLALLMGAGCAKISEPQPPQIRIPKPATDLSARQLSEFIVLSFSMPTQNTDGSPATTLRNVDIFRLTEDLNTGKNRASLAEEQFLQEAVRVLSIPASKFSDYLREETFLIHDKLPLPEGSLMDSSAFRYAVRFVNKKNQAAGLSNQAFIKPVRIPLPPAQLTAEVTENFIRLTWHPPSENMDGSKPAKIVGYNIYRSEEPGAFPGAPINSEPVLNPAFEDRHFQYNKTYYYAVSILGSLQDPCAESRPSNAFSAVARDIFPPLPPKNFSAVLDGASIVLLWTASASQDVAGYRVYRIDVGTTAWQPLENELISALSYRDKRADSKSRYRIVAVDAHGNESAPVTTAVETQ